MCPTAVDNIQVHHTIHINLNTVMIKTIFFSNQNVDQRVVWTMILNLHTVFHTPNKMQKVLKTKNILPHFFEPVN